MHVRTEHAGQLPLFHFIHFAWHCHLGWSLQGCVHICPTIRLSVHSFIHAFLPYPQLSFLPLQLLLLCGDFLCVWLTHLLTRLPSLARPVHGGWVSSTNNNKNNNNEGNNNGCPRENGYLTMALTLIMMMRRIDHDVVDADNDDDDAHDGGVHINST